MGWKPTVEVASEVASVEVASMWDGSRVLRLPVTSSG